MSYLRDKLPELSPPVVERVFTPDLKGLVAWLETQDGRRSYDWFNCEHCVAGEFLAAIGCKNDTRAFGQARIIFGGNVDRYMTVTKSEPHTFGAALSRARQALTEAK